MPVLEISNLKKSYVAPDGARSLVIDVPQFTLEAGEQVALAGASGVANFKPKPVAVFSTPALPPEIPPTFQKARMKP